MSIENDSGRDCGLNRRHMNVDPEIAYQLMHKDNGKSLAKAIDPARVQSLIMSSRLPDADDWPA